MTRTDVALFISLGFAAVAGWMFGQGMIALSAFDLVVSAVIGFLALAMSKEDYR